MYDYDQARKTAKAIFSVGPRKGKPVVENDYGLRTVSQRARVHNGGLYRVVATADSFYGDGKDYRGALLENPTWGKLLGEASRVMRRTGDLHHSFLEGYRVIGEETSKDGRPVKIIELVMGS